MEFIIKEKCLKIFIVHNLLDFAENFYLKNLFFSKESFKYILYAHAHTLTHPHTHTQTHIQTGTHMFTVIGSYEKLG